MEFWKPNVFDGARNGQLRYCFASSMGSAIDLSLTFLRIHDSLSPAAVFAHFDDSWQEQQRVHFHPIGDGGEVARLTSENFLKRTQFLFLLPVEMLSIILVPLLGRSACGNVQLFSSFSSRQPSEVMPPLRRRREREYPM